MDRPYRSLTLSTIDSTFVGTDPFDEMSYK